MTNTLESVSGQAMQSQLDLREEAERSLGTDQKRRQIQRRLAQGVDVVAGDVAHHLWIPQRNLGGVVAIKSTHRGCELGDAPRAAVPGDLPE